MDEEVDLPEVPIPHIKNPVQPFSTSSTRCKRPRLEDEDDLANAALSSDPALFSSDEYPSGIENYALKRRKQQWTGTWWGERRDDAPKRKRSFKRNLDSGIFLGSESTDSGLEDEFLADVLPQSEFDMRVRGSNYESVQDDVRTSHDAVRLTDGNTLARREVGNASAQYADNVPGQSFYVTGDMPPWLSSTSSDTSFNADSIKHAIENGCDSIDLSGRNISELTPDIRVLDTITVTNPIPTLAPVNASSYTPFTPNIKLYLANNALTSLPMELYQLQHLTVLSVRHNHLKNIYPLVGSLQNLEELNLSFNDLVSLPYELLSLIRNGTLRRFYAFPNPFVMYQSAETVPNPKKLDPRFPTKVAESVPYFFKPDGSPFYPYENDIARRELLNGPTINTKQPSSDLGHSPSLFEQCLLSYSKLYGVKRLNGLFEDAGLSEKAKLVENFVRGRQRCSVCGTRRVIMRVEWAEWYELGRSISQNRNMEDNVAGENENVVPFERAACSPACYARRM